MTDLLPVQKIDETSSLICFYHPQPAYKVHILFVPKEDIRDLLQLEVHESRFLSDLFMITKKIVSELGLEDKGYRLIVNGGKYQDFPQLHFHLISGD
jgi:histidine triad (HIT) family protein